MGLGLIEGTTGLNLGWCANDILFYSTSPTFIIVYARLVFIINTKFPQNGELIIKRILIQFRKSFRRNYKEICCIFSTNGDIMLK
jgi:hypothetical protein